MRDRFVRYGAAILGAALVMLVMVGLLAWQLVIVPREQAEMAAGRFLFAGPRLLENDPSDGIVGPQAQLRELIRQAQLGRQRALLALATLYAVTPQNDLAMELRKEEVLRTLIAARWRLDNATRATLEARILDACQKRNFDRQQCRAFIRSLQRAA